ncbi:chemotaxis response regulator protein-glutamate methylesterase [Clostridium neuense]|uniref:Protein-glutamate methylesterase/protein-glutamine glutaminase n=1 Tax=Clostridium neuense TaxID=1728934 RepID=A0ABW8TJZ7_9CLOT
MKEIKVIVADDSALMRKLISDMLNSDENIEVIKTAYNGKDLINKIQVEKPDAITLDIEMPIMGGIETLKEMRRMNCLIPTIVISGVSHRNTTLTMDCLHYGAFDFIAKPSGGMASEIIDIKKQLIEKVKLAAYRNLNLYETKSVISKEEHKRIDNNVKIQAVVIGASTGGPKALYKVITKFPQNMGVPIFVVQHMPVGFTKAFAERLNDNSSIRVKEAEDNEIYENNVVYIAPGGYHMEIGSNGRISLNKEPPIWGVRPAVDKLFISASKVFGSHLVSAVLTGMGRDGANGTKIIKDNGGITLSESESTCVIYGMPKAAYETGKVDIVAPIDSIANEIIKITTDIRR